MTVILIMYIGLTVLILLNGVVCLGASHWKTTPRLLTLAWIAQAFGGAHVLLIVMGVVPSGLLWFFHSLISLGLLAQLGGERREDQPWPRHLHIWNKK